jgi:RNA polymerase sigma-70 factor (ECF subfamily)
MLETAMKMATCCKQSDRRTSGDPDRNAQLDQLLSAVAGGDHRAFARLDHLVRPILLGQARKVVGQRYDIDEIVQEALIAIWRGAAMYDAARAAPLTWMVAIMRNQALDRLRRTSAAKRCGDHAFLDEWQERTTPSPCQFLENEQALAALSRCLASLSPDQRDAVAWTWLRGLTHSEAASKMNKPLGTVKTLIRRALLRVRATSEAA